MAGGTVPCHSGPGDAVCPPALHPPLSGRSSTITHYGSLGLLELPLVALFSSSRPPPDLILPTFRLARTIRETSTPTVGGFHTPLESEVLRLLLRGRQPLVVCPARGIEGMRLPSAWRAALDAGRLLVLSTFPGRRRASVSMAADRNALVVALARRLFVVHARPGGRVFRVAAGALYGGMRVDCFDHPGNRELVLLGARPAHQWGEGETGGSAREAVASALRDRQRSG